MVMSDFLFFENFVLLLLVGYQTSGRHQYVKTTTPPLALPNCCPEGYFQIIWLNQCWTRTTWLVKHRLRVNVCVCVGACMPDVMFDHSYITVLFGATYLQWCAICEHMDGGDNMVIGRDMAVFNMPIQLAWTFSVMIFLNADRILIIASSAAGTLPHTQPSPACALDFDAGLCPSDALILAK